MLWQKKGLNIPDTQVETIRKYLHDLRATQHAVHLNAEAALTLAEKVPEDPATRRLQQHLKLMQTDLDKFKQKLEALSTLLEP